MRWPASGAKSICRSVRICGRLTARQRIRTKSRMGPGIRSRRRIACSRSAARRTTSTRSSGPVPTIGILGSSGETPEVTLPGSASQPVVVGSKLYFTAASASSTTNSQLWSSDGTQANTKMVEDFSTVPTVSSSASPGNLTDADGSLFFTVAGTDGLDQLWTSNGTGQGTVLVKDLGSSSGGYTGYGYGYGYGYTSAPGSLGLLAPVGTNLFFMASDSTHGAELWSDDVATGTTQLVKDIDPGPGSSDPHEFVAFNNQLYFAANDGASPLVNELWTSDGSGAGTVQVASFTPAMNLGSAEPPDFSSTTTDFATLGSSSCSCSMTASTAPPSGRPTGRPRGPRYSRRSTRRPSRSSTGRPTSSAPTRLPHSDSGRPTGRPRALPKSRTSPSSGPRMATVGHRAGSWPAAMNSTSGRVTAAAVWTSGPATARRPAPPSSRISRARSAPPVMKRT